MGAWGQAPYPGLEAHETVQKAACVLEVATIGEGLDAAALVAGRVERVVGRGQVLPRQLL